MQSAVGMTRPVLCWVLLLTSSAVAEDLFSVSARTTSGTPKSITATGSDITDLVTHLIRNESQFQTLQNRDVLATIRYAGVNNAITIRKNGANTSAAVNIPAIGFNKTFTASNENNLKNQIIDYAKKDGASEYGKFLRQVNEQSTVGVADGNPLAATALLSDYQYLTWGLQPAPFPDRGPLVRLDAVSAPNIRLDASGGYAHTDDGNGYFVSGALTLGFRLTDQVALALATPFEYRRVEGANVYVVGQEAALPISLVPGKGDRSLSWTLTPAAVGGAAGSLELAAGGTFVGAGITSSLGYQLDDWTFTLADHYGFYHGFPIDIGNYRFDTNLSQQVLKNGLKVTRTFGRSVFIDGSITYSNFLQRAAVDHYWTPAAGVGLRFGPNAGLRVGYFADVRSKFRVQGGQAEVYFNF